MYGGRTLSSIWVALGPVLILNAIAILTMIIFALGQAFKKIPQSQIPESARRNKSIFLNTFLREWWVWMTDPVALFFVKIKWTPNIITFIGFLFSVLAGILFAFGKFGYAGWIMVFGASFDIFDGRVARLTNNETKSGAFFDSVMDRFGEAAVFVGLAYFFRNSFLLPFVVAGLAGSMFVSYTRARGEAVGIVCKVGSMQRPERIVYIGVSSLMTPVLDVILLRWWSAPAPILTMIAIMIVAIMTNLTAIYRMIFIMNALDAKSGHEDKDSIPQFLAKLSSHEGRENLWKKARFGYDRKNVKASPFILLLVPGWNDFEYKSLLENNELPEITKLKSNNGQFETVTSFPATLGPAEIPFVTGCFPGTADIPGTKWFAQKIGKNNRIIQLGRYRDYKGWGGYAIDYDMNPSIKTLFQYSKQAISIFGTVNRGCGLLRDPAFFQTNHLFLEDYSSNTKKLEEAAMAWMEKSLDKGIDAIVCTFPSLMLANKPDAIKKAYKNLDLFLANLNSSLKRRHIFDKAKIMLSASWANTNNNNQFDLSNFMQKKFKNSVFNDKPKFLNTDALALTSGGGMANLYFRKDNWKSTTFFEELEINGFIASLLENEQVDFAAGRSEDGGIVVLNKKGKIQLREDKDGRITCFTRGQNPIGPDDMPKTADESLVFEKTISSQYPDGIVQLLNLFSSNRCGDIIISAAGGCSFTSDKYVHGSLHESHRRLPLFANFVMDFKPSRTADIFPFIIDQIGLSTEHHLDGHLENLESDTANKFETVG